MTEIGRGKEEDVTKSYNVIFEIDIGCEHHLLKLTSAFHQYKKRYYTVRNKWIEQSIDGEAVTSSLCKDKHDTLFTLTFHPVVIRLKGRKRGGW